jgi:HAE1 family hydrophobic/amphiphilic exporter-1
MNLSSTFIRRPVMTTLLMAAILVFGWMSYRRLPVSDLPNVDFPTLQVTAALPGASAETMAASVATPLEREFSTIAGIDSMTSVSLQGSTQVTLQFNLERDIDAAAQDVQAAISRAGRGLPPEMPSPPSYKKVNPADQPVLFLAVTSPTLPLYQLNEYAETLMSQRISMLPGVAQVVVYGSQKYAVRVQVDPRQAGGDERGDRRGGAGDPGPECEPAGGCDQRAAGGADDRDHGSTDVGGEVHGRDHGVPGRAAALHAADRGGKGWGGKRPDRGVVQGAGV